MRNYNSKKYILLLAAVCGLIILSAYNFYAYAQYNKSALLPPPSVPSNEAKKAAESDSSATRFKVKSTIPQGYGELYPSEKPIDLKDPSNITSQAEFDPETGCYVIRTKIGEREITTPFILSADEYNNLVLRQSMQEYYRQKNSQSNEQTNNPFNFLDMNFSLGPLEKVFGPGGVQLKTTGSVQINTGIKTNKTDNPALSLGARKKTYFDFDQKIQANINASVGDKMKFTMSYNTDATFDFDSKNLKLQYEGKEDEIIKNIEAGNVSMTTGSSLIRGSNSLFGVKTKLQFGKLTATALVSQQNAETKTVSTRGGAQTTKFTVNADNYDANRHFFLGHFFRDNYDLFCSKLPLVSSGISITRIEVWITNKRGNYEQSRNIVGFMDLGESQRVNNSHWATNSAVANPSNTSNNLLSEITSQYADARYISQTTSVLEPLSAYGITGGQDYEKVESARLLSSSEYTLNSALGYISLKSALNADEVLAVAYQYTYRGQTYQVGEFSGDIASTEQSLFVKMLKGTTVSPRLPMWDLMMKNVYSLGAYQVQKTNFKLNIKYLSDTTGTQITYIPVGAINGTPLLQVMNLDNIDSNNNLGADGRYDFIDGYTIYPSTGKIVFPVVEPFGSHLRKKIGNDQLADKFVYEQLYDSTLTVARQYQDKNKFVLTGEYQASSGSQIRLNAMNVPRGSVVVTAGGVTLTENSDYTVDYSMGIVTITNQSIIDAGTNISVSLENQSVFSMQRKTLLGLDLNYKFNKDFNIGGTIMHYGEKSLTEKVAIGDETVKNTIWGLNFNYKNEFMWLTNLLNKIPTVNATAPSTLNVNGEFAHIIPHKAISGSTQGSSYIDDFESTQSGIDLRSPYSWFLASTPYDNSANALFPEASLSNNIEYGKNRALLSWYYIDRLFTQRNSSMCPGYLKNDLAQQSNPYVREITYSEIFPNRELNYGESSTIQTLNLSFYPNERGPYNLDANNINAEGELLNPEKRWGGIMRKLDNTNFDASNIEYIQFWLMDPFLDPENPNTDGGDLYFNLGEMSEDILKDGLKSYENGLPIDGGTRYTKETVWGRVSSNNSLTYAFDNTAGSRKNQDLGLNGLNTESEKAFPTYQNFVNDLRRKLSSDAVARMESDPFSPFNDPAGDNYHFYRGYDYDEMQLSIHDRYKHYNGTEGNSLSVEDANVSLYQSARSVPDVEDINQDNTLNEYERYFQYKISIRPSDLVVGQNYITNKQVSNVRTRDGEKQEVTWYQFKIPVKDFEKAVGSISDFSTIRFIRMFMTGFKTRTHLRFATLELVRGEWRPYDFQLDVAGDLPAEGNIDIDAVNIEEHAGREPVNYILPPGVTRIVDSSQSQATQLNEQSMSLKVTDLEPGKSRAVYRNTSLDLRIYNRLQMFAHNEALIDDFNGVSNGDVSLFVRFGSDIKNNYYEYEIPLEVTPAGKYANREAVWPASNMLDCALDLFPAIKKQRNAEKMQESSGVSYNRRYSVPDPNRTRNTVTVIGNPSISDIRVILIGVKNNSGSVRNCNVWVNELRVTDFNNEGGWAAKANINLGLSDLATLNLSGQKETSGFGAVDQSLSERRIDNLDQYNIAVQADLGRFLPEVVKLKAPIYYSVSNEKITPKYNPLDQDVLLEEAIDACATQSQRDSIEAYAVTNKKVESFSISGLNFGVSSKNPMPWDPSNFTLSYSSNKQRNNDPNNVFENTNDYRGNFQYNYSPYFKPFKPFKKIKGKQKGIKFLRDWEFSWLPSSIAFNTNMSRYYYEQQERNESDIEVELPISVSKNFIWDRQLAVTWNFTKTLSMSFNTNTTAHIEEPMGVVNRQLFPDRYTNWKDSVMRSLRSFGTPYSYRQSFTASYKAPFNKIGATDFITANATYNANYNWDRGTTLDTIATGHTVANQASLSLDGRFNLEQLYKKFEYLKNVNERFSKKKSTRKTKPKRFSRSFRLKEDTSIIISHNLKTKKIKITALEKGKAIAIKSRIIDANKVEILNRGKGNVKFTITESLDEDKSLWVDIAEHATRFAMMVRNVNVRYKDSRGLSLPQFIPSVGNAFGQTSSYDIMAPGLDFAFGLTDDSYIPKAKSRGWLLCDETQTAPALYSKTSEFNLEIALEPIRGLKITLTNNRTDNRTNQVQFMYNDMNTIYSGSYTKTHLALATALRGCSADDGYNSDAFNNFLEYIPAIRSRIESQYADKRYPTNGFMMGHALAGQSFDRNNGGTSETSSDVLIPAFVAAYSGKSPHKVTLNPFPGLAEILPNWRLTYDGLIEIGKIRKYFKSFTLTHAYQCTYSVGSFTSFTDWVGIGNGLGFTRDQLTQNPIPSSPFNISSVAITEKFAPLIGVNATMNNNVSFNAEYRDSRTLTLNSDAGQVVEAGQKSFVFGAGYKFVNFNTFLKLKGSQKGVSNDLTLNLECNFSNNTALIRKIDTRITQATSGSKTLSINFTANYVLSKRVTVGAYFDHQANTPLVSSSAYPTTNSSYGISINMSLTK